MKTLFIAWQDPKTRRWLPVGRLTSDRGKFCFVYTKGALESNKFLPFGRMDNLNSIYESDDLFPLFANRLLPKSRPEFADFIRWLNIDGANPDPLLLLSLTGGIRGTDNLEVFPCPEPNELGMYELHFFNHGLSHMAEAAIDRVSCLKRGERLYLLHDMQNPYDSMALALRTDDPATIVGYCPRYFAKDFHRLINGEGAESVFITVEKINKDAPLQFRVLCKIISKWPKNFAACSDPLYQPLIGQTVCPTAI